MKKCYVLEVPHTDKCTVFRSLKRLVTTINKDRQYQTIRRILLEKDQAIINNVIIRNADFIESTRNKKNGNYSKRR